MSVGSTYASPGSCLFEDNQAFGAQDGYLSTHDHITNKDGVGNTTNLHDHAVGMSDG